MGRKDTALLFVVRNLQLRPHLESEVVTGTSQGVGQVTRTGHRRWLRDLWAAPRALVCVVPTGH
jgi:hypothetical protein